MDDEKSKIEKKEKTELIELKNKADNGDVIAQKNLGRFYYNSFKFEEAREYLLKAIEQDDGDSELLLGIMNYQGLFGKVNYTESLNLFKKAIEHKLPLAFFNLGQQYINGLGVQKNLLEGIKYYLGGIKNIEADIQSLEKKSENYSEKEIKNIKSNLIWGYSEKVTDLLPILQNKELSKEDLETIVTEIKADAANGDHYLEFILGMMYKLGVGVDEDKNKSLELLQKSAEAGNFQAQGYLALGYALGTYAAVDLEKSDYWCEKSYSQNYLLPKFYLSKFYLGNQVVSDHVAKGLNFLNTCVEDGLSYAQVFMSKLYYYGIFVEKDVKKAIDLAFKAIENKTLEAYCLLGLYYLLDENGEGKFSEAFSLFSTAAITGSLEASVWVGLMYELGFGVEQDCVKAVSYYKNAAEVGEPVGLFFLGRCFENGIGIARDVNGAAIMYQYSAQLGNPVAVRALTNLHVYLEDGLEGFDLINHIKSLNPDNFRKNANPDILEIHHIINNLLTYSVNSELAKLNTQIMSESQAFKSPEAEAQKTLVEASQNINDTKESATKLNAAQLKMQRRKKKK